MQVQPDREILDYSSVEKIINEQLIPNLDQLFEQTEKSGELHQCFSEKLDEFTQLQKDYHKDFTELLRLIDTTKEIADRAFELEEEEKQLLAELEEKKLKNHKLKKSYEKENLIHIKNSESIQSAKELALSDANSWSRLELGSGLVLGAIGGSIGLLTGGPLGMGTAAFAGLRVGGDSLQKLLQNNQASKKELASATQVSDPENCHSISIKFAPSTASFNWIPYMTKWKDSATVGCFKIIIGYEVYESTFDTNARGKGALDIDEQLKLLDALTNALVQGKITGEKCSHLLGILSEPLHVPCEREEGKVQMITVQLLDKEDTVFIELASAVGRLYMNNLENSLLISSINSV